MLRKVVGLLGLATIVFVIANVHFGMVADNVVEGAGTARLDVLRLADPGCTIPEMEKEIQETGTAFCLGEKGTWGAADIFLLFWGILIVTAGRFPNALRSTPCKANSSSCWFQEQCCSLWLSSIDLNFFRLLLTRVASLTSFRSLWIHGWYRFSLPSLARC